MPLLAVLSDVHLHLRHECAHAVLPEKKRTRRMAPLSLPVPVPYGLRLHRSSTMHQP